MYNAYLTHILNLYIPNTYSMPNTGDTIDVLDLSNNARLSDSSALELLKVTFSSCLFVSSLELSDTTICEP